MYHSEKQRLFEIDRGIEEPASLTYLDLSKVSIVDKVRLNEILSKIPDLKLKPEPVFHGELDLIGATKNIKTIPAPKLEETTARILDKTSSSFGRPVASQQMHSKSLLQHHHNTASIHGPSIIVPSAKSFVGESSSRTIAPEAKSSSDRVKWNLRDTHIYTKDGVSHHENVPNSLYRPSGGDYLSKPVQTKKTTTTTKGVNRKQHCRADGLRKLLPMQTQMKTIDQDDHYPFADPMPESMARQVNINDLILTDIDWKMLTLARPSNSYEEEFFSKLVHLHRLRYRLRLNEGHETNKRNIFAVTRHPKVIQYHTNKQRRRYSFFGPSQTAPLSSSRTVSTTEQQKSVARGRLTPQLNDKEDREDKEEIEKDWDYEAFSRQEQDLLNSEHLVTKDKLANSVTKSRLQQHQQQQINHHHHRNEIFSDSSSNGGLLDGLEHSSLDDNNNIEDLVQTFDSNLDIDTILEHLMMTATVT